MVPLCSDKISRVSPYSRFITLSTHTGLSPIIADFSKSFWFLRYKYWAGPRSLVTTSGVSVDFLSSRYLDISVLWVCFYRLFIHLQIPQLRWVSPFGHPRVTGYWHLAAAFRSLSRPSSPLIAKASTKCSYYT